MGSPSGTEDSWVQMRPVLTGLEIGSLERWLLFRIFLNWYFILGEVKGSLVAELSCMSNSCDRGPQQMSLFTWEWWTAIDVSIQVTRKDMFKGSSSY